MPVSNGGFETAGASAGLAASWTLGVTAVQTELFTVDSGGVETFARGWRLPMGSPGVTVLGTFNHATNVFTDGAAITDTAAVARFLARRTGVLDATTTLNVTYVNETGVAGRAGNVVLPTTPISGNHIVTLQAGDLGVRDVTAASEAAGGSTSGSSELRAVRGLLWAEGTAGNMEASGELTNTSHRTVFVDADLVAALFTDGPAVERFEFGWNNAGAVLRDFDGLVTGAQAFDAIPVAAGILVSETVEDFEEGWASPRAVTVALGSYRVVNNVYTAEAAPATLGNAVASSYPQPVNPRARITEAFGATAQTLSFTYRSFAGDATLSTGRLTIPAGAQIGQEIGIQVPPHTGDATETRGVYGIQRLEPGGMTETPDVAQLGAFSIEVTQIWDPVTDTSAFNRGVVLRSSNRRLAVGTGTAAVTYETRAEPAPAVTIEHVAGGAGQLSTTVSVVGVAVTVTLRGGAIPPAAADFGLYPGTQATAQEVADKVNSTTLLVRATAGGNDASNPAVVVALTPMPAPDFTYTLATFDGPGFAATVEDFESGWSSNEDSRTAFAAESLGGGFVRAFIDLAVAGFGSTTALGSFNAVTGVYTDGAVMPGTARFQQFIVDVTTPLVESIAGARLRYTLVADVGGAFVVTPLTNGLTTSRAGASILITLPVGTSNGSDFTLINETLADGTGADSFSSGAVAIRGAINATAETFDGAASTALGWVLTFS